MAGNKYLLCGMPNKRLIFAAFGCRTLASSRRIAERSATHVANLSNANDGMSFVRA
jgi:hypothetical protein